MKNEREDTANANMAGAGHDSGISQNGERVQEATQKMISNRVVRMLYAQKKDVQQSKK